MGTGGPPVTVRAATLAGGDKNQDRYAYGDGWAFVLDGASSFATEQPEHDGGWYAERLKDALVHELTSRPDDATTDIVARAIENAASAHEDPETCPTSTIAMTRWSHEIVSIFVLGDSTAVIIDNEGAEEEISDLRLAEVAPALRAEYRSRLADGCGFDDGHRELLQELQVAQRQARNAPSGYWIAGADPSAATHALTRTRPRSGLRRVLLATDGAAATQTTGLSETWRDAAGVEPQQLLAQLHSTEERDPSGVRWPRGKPHDDKTMVVIDWRD